MKAALCVLGVMTGNSLDAIDTVITKLTSEGGIHDQQHYSHAFPSDLAAKIRELRTAISEEHGDTEKAAKRGSDPQWIAAIADRYVDVVAEACLATIVTARTAKTIGRDEVPDLVGFHGQTCGHYPPSIARSTGEAPYTVQLGDGQRLADALRIPVAYDFRSDDVLNGGEGAPLAPIHHLHLAMHTKSQGIFPIAFINAGNTGNISVITHQLGKKDPIVIGWDTGPFNHLPDLLARRELGRPHDANGEVGLPGSVNPTLLRLLFEKSAVTANGTNFLTLPPPRSSDPQWYRALPELLGEAPVDGEILSIADRMRTAEYFAAYAVMFSLSFVPSDCEMPHFVGLCGGGWKNPVVANHFRALMRHSSGQVILGEHEQVYTNLIARFGKKLPTVESTSAFGFDPSSMEARIFADAAARLVWGEPFTRPSVTGTKSPTVCGRIRFPSGASPKDFLVGRIMSEMGHLIEAQSLSGFSDRHFGRAIANR